MTQYGETNRRSFRPRTTLKVHRTKTERNGRAALVLNSAPAAEKTHVLLLVSADSFKMVKL